MSNSFRVQNTAKEKQPTRYYSGKQEKAVAKALNGTQTPNSGATTFVPGDVYIGENLFALECKTKTSDSESITIKREWFEKQIKETIQSGKKYNAIVFNFGPNAPYNENHYIIDEYLFQILVEYLKEQEPS